MSDIMSILSSAYASAATTTYSRTKYVPVDATLYQGTWTGKYANGQSLTLTVSNVKGFHAKVMYRSGSTVNYQDVLIKDNSFRFGESQFTLAGNAVAQIATVVTDPYTGAASVQTTYAQQQS